MHRQESLKRLQTETFDLCIIGGGASGAGCALDAALRGLKVALVEKSDFAAGTSSKSTKLIHGGVRYLEQAFKNFDFGQLRQVHHGLEERHTVLSNAPHLARPLALVTPVFHWWEGLYFRIGLWLYDRFASGKDSLPGSRWLNKAEARRRLPGLTKRLHSAVLYYDGQLDDARYCLALVQSAAEAGAIVLNYTETIGFEKDANGKICAAQLRDTLSGQTMPLRAGLFLNCTGPAADRIRALANPCLLPRIRLSKGVHLLLPQSVLGNPDTALLIPKTPDGRVVFAIPFQGELLLGTTDQEYADPDLEPVLEAAEVDYLLETLQPYLLRKVNRRAVKAGFGGLRPLINTLEPSSGGGTKSLVRDHEVEYDPESGLLSLMGGKWTTYRLMASDAVDAACRLLGVNAPCTTAEHILTGGAGYDAGAWRELSREYDLPEDVARHLSHNYGSQATAVAGLIAENPDWARRLAPGHPFIGAEVIHAVRHEMALTPRDLLARRIRLEILDWKAAWEALPAVSELMGRELRWNTEEQALHRTTYAALLVRFQEAVAG